LTNVNLDLSYGDQIEPILKKILPLISGIDSIIYSDLFDWVYDNDRETQMLLKKMVAQTRILTFSIFWLVCPHGLFKICL
jgi:hypothetical protein